MRVDGTDLTALTETERARRRRQGLGFVFQSFNLIPTLTVGENVELPLALNGVAHARGAAAQPRAARRSSASRAAPTDSPRTFPAASSSASPIARAVIHEPKLVLADEPTGNLDVETAHHVLELLQRTCRDRNATLLVATHSAEIAAHAARVLTIRAGRIEDAAP